VVTELSTHPVRNMVTKDYVQEKRMDRLGEWGTDFELRAAATILHKKISVSVCLKVQDTDMVVWQTFAPADGREYTDCGTILIWNSKDHFMPVIG